MTKQLTIYKTIYHVWVDGGNPLEDLFTDDLGEAEDFYCGLEVDSWQVAHLHEERYYSEEAYENDWPDEQCLQTTKDAS